MLFERLDEQAAVPDGSANAAAHPPSHPPTHPPGARPVWPDALPAALAAWAAPDALPPARPLVVAAPATVAATPAAAPPPAVAPRPAYTLVGVLQQPAGWTALLAGPQRSLAVRAGDVIDSQWRVDQVSAAGMVGTWLPQGLPYSLQHGPAAPPTLTSPGSPAAAPPS